MSDLVVIPIILTVIAAAVATEVIVAVLPTLILTVLVPADERAGLAALVQATHGRHRHAKTFAAVWVGTVTRARARALRMHRTPTGPGLTGSDDQAGPASSTAGRGLRPGAAGVARNRCDESPTGLPNRPVDDVVQPVAAPVPRGRRGAPPRNGGRTVSGHGFRWP